MKKPKDIDPTQAREKVQDGRALLVCAYDDESKCKKVLLDGAMTMSQLRTTLAKRNKDEQLNLYCV